MVPRSVCFCFSAARLRSVVLKATQSQARRQANSARSHAAKAEALRRGKAGLSPAHARSIRVPTHHHPSSLYKSTVSARLAAMITGTQAAAIAEVSPAMAKLRETSARTKKANPAAIPPNALS